jgi:sterol desaturase/sphingolipid hydroxylase (fatty acid hydroxylase superfamily)
MSNTAYKGAGAISLNNLYKNVYDAMKGDQCNITLLTIAVMWLSEIPMFTFTLLDILKLKTLFPYRLHYDPDHASHLGQRKYPPLDLILKTAAVSERNFLLAYIVPAIVLIKIGSKLGIYVYDTEEGDKKVTWWRILKETFMISVVADFLFYGLHRLMHTKRFYPMHKIHHEFKYSIAMAHHYMKYFEAVIFALPQALPPLMLWAATGQRVHIISMWLGVFYTQTSAILGHAGYRIPFIPSWLPFFQASYHDLHHIDYKVNFGAIYPFTDMLFGTYVKAALDKAVKVPADGNITMKTGVQ